MMPDLVPARMRNFYRTAVEWSSLNPVLLEGEIGFISDTDPIQHKVGDGVTAWTGLSVAGGGGGASLTLDTLSHSTASLAAGDAENFTIPAGDAYMLLAVTASYPAWIRIYRDAAGRTADEGRTTPGAPFPEDGSGFVAELQIEAADGTLRFSPVPIGQGDAGDAYVRVVNDDSVSRVIDLDFELVSII